MARRQSRQGVKLHRSYTYDEAAPALGVHKNTIAAWVRSGDLPALKDCRPYLILGRELIAFQDRRRQSARTKLKPGEMYCLGCKAAQKPAEGMVDELLTMGGAANLQALCPTCGACMHRRVARPNVQHFMEAAEQPSSTHR